MEIYGGKRLKLKRTTSKRAQRQFRWFRFERRFDGSQNRPPVGGNLPRLVGDQHLRQSPTQSNPLILWESMGMGNHFGRLHDGSNCLKVKVMQGYETHKSRQLMSNTTLFPSRKSQRVYGWIIGQNLGSLMHFDAIRIIQESDDRDTTFHQNGIE